MQERKAKLQLLKQKSTCRSCGQTGHWKGDKECRNSGKGGFGGGKSSGKGGFVKRLPQPKSRANPVTTTRTGYLAIASHKTVLNDKEGIKTNCHTAHADPDDSDHSSDVLLDSPNLSE